MKYKLALNLHYEKEGTKLVLKGASIANKRVEGRTLVVTRLTKGEKMQLAEMAKKVLAES